MSRRDQLRRYPPLAGVVLAVLLAAFVLPSALNVPLSNPTQTLEFAPVPPDEDVPLPPAGNVARLGLGSSSSVPRGDVAGGDGPGLPPPAPPVPGGAGERPITKRCVGDPPRQTEDPSSPPCVAHFDGDNGGATHRGASGEEVRVLLYVDGTGKQAARGYEDESALQGRYFDLTDPPSDEDTVTIRNLRRFQTYFNQRYQTYGRLVHFHVYFASECCASVTPELRRAEAADNLAEVQPFAVLTSGLRYGLDDVYSREMARAGVLSFGSSAGSRPAAFFQAFPSYLWSYPPTVETRAELFASHVCSKVVGAPVVDSGVEGQNGQPRRLGLLRTTDENQPQLIAFAALTKERIEACGGAFVSEATFPTAGKVSQSFSEDTTASYASRNMAQFQRDSVTTVIWAGGYESDQTRAAGMIGYLPEWIVAGDGLHESAYNSGYQDSSVWAHAWTVTTIPRIGGRDVEPCEAAAREADPTTTSEDVYWACSEPYYTDLRQLFTGIQVAGPRLAPETIDRGFHAIPAIPSDDAYVPACYYAPNDYTCVKDATVMHWDPEGVPTGGSRPGCWRMAEDGRRYLVDEWPPGNLDAQARLEDVCTTYTSTALLF